MGAALYIVVNSTEPGFDTFVSGKALSRAEEKLTAAAKKLDVTPLMEFYGMSADDVASAAEEFGVAAGTGPEQWFDPDDGLRTVRSLLGLLDTDPKAFDNRVREELLEFAKVLQQAKQRGLRWHLAVDY